MLQVGNGGTVGNIAGNGSFGIDRSDTYTFGGVISVTGSFVKAGTGKVILTGNNTYQGGTAINAGTLAVSTDANLGNTSGGLTFGAGRYSFSQVSPPTVARRSMLAAVPSILMAIARRWEVRSAALAVLPSSVPARLC